MSQGEQLSAEHVKQLAAIRQQLRKAVEFASSLGDGGWNHGAKVVNQVAEVTEESARAMGSIDKLLSESPRGS